MSCNWVKKKIIICVFLFYFISIEIAKVRASLFQINGVKKEPLKLPEAEGTPVTLNEKVYVPVREHPDVSRKKNMNEMHLIDLIGTYIHMWFTVTDRSTCVEYVCINRVKIN